jgi:hypothetical protein
MRNGEKYTSDLRPIPNIGQVDSGRHFSFEKSKADRPPGTLINIHTTYQKTKFTLKNNKQEQK